MENVVTAFSFTPQEISDQLENQVPSVSKRISAMRRLAEKGWKLGVRLDPIIDCQDFDKRYDSLISEIFDQVPSDSIHSVSLGPFRLPSPFSKRWKSSTHPNLYLQETLKKEAAPSVIQKKWKHKELEHADNYFFPAYLLKSSFSANRLKIKTFSDCHLRFFFYSHIL